MSINLEQPRLNEAGQITQATLASFAVNGLVHPISTIKNRLMAGSLVSLRQLTSTRGLYNGFRAICCVDAATFSVAYLTNNLFLGRETSLWPSVAAGLLSSPFVAFGEGLMANRQVNAMQYVQVIRRAMRLNGLITTAFREIPFSVAVFYAAPLIDRNIQSISPEWIQSKSYSICLQIISGGVAGAGAGFITAPVDLIKTRVQTSHQETSILQVIRNAIVIDGFRGLYRGGGARALYISLSVAIMNILNNTVPSRLPEALRAKD